MEKPKTLYRLLSEMETVAENGDRNRVVVINQKFASQYNDLFSDKPYVEGSMKMALTGQGTAALWL